MENSRAKSWSAIGKISYEKQRLSNPDVKFYSGNLARFLTIILSAQNLSRAVHGKRSLESGHETKVGEFLSYVCGIWEWSFELRISKEIISLTVKLKKAGSK